jgi:SAM-dependent methyltransferase
MTSSIYGERFYDWVNMTSRRSAELVVPIVKEQVAASSVLDVGCGQGAWLSIWAKSGVGRVFGLDGEHVDTNHLLISLDQFMAADLRHGWCLDDRFDLVQCLEVAEHLPQSDAEALVRRLCNQGDVVFFSAAQPGQGGAGHVNEQFPSYWAELFSRQGFAPFDSIRPMLGGQKAVAPWYRFNALLFANSRGAERLSAPALRCKVANFAELDGVGDLGWRLRCAVLRYLPVRVVTRLSELRYRLVLLFQNHQAN